MANLSDRKVHSPPERAVKIILGILDRSLEKTCRNKEEVAPRGQNDLSIFPNEHHRQCFNSQGINAEREREKMLARRGIEDRRNHDLSFSPTHGLSETIVFIAIAGLVPHRRDTSWIIPTWYCAIC
jgi:hypothetical protein